MLSDSQGHLISKGTVDYKVIYYEQWAQNGFHMHSGLQKGFLRHSGLRRASTCTVDSKNDFSFTVGSEGLSHAQ